MVLSTSSATQLDVGGSPYSVFVKQLAGAVAGLAMIWALSKAPPGLFRAIATPMLLAAVAGLLVVLAFGQEVDGAKRWIVIAGTPVQPSEFAKLAFLLWGADLLARKEKLRQLDDWRTLLIPLLPGAAVIAMLVMLGHDFGTTFLLLIILLALLWVIGTPARAFAGILGLIVFAMLLLIIVEPYSNSRLTSFLNQGGSPTGPDMQGIQGRWAIGSGGLFGVGLGDSMEKWGWVPNASTDFIFAILGEELGLIGTVCVTLLYSVFAYAGLRVARRMQDTFMRLAAAAATAWIVAQALVNIGAVIGLLPITGVPLPLISQGLSSLLATMAAIGMLLSFARREPGAAEALAVAGHGRLRRWIHGNLRGTGAGRPAPVPRSGVPKGEVPCGELPRGGAPGPLAGPRQARPRPGPAHPRQAPRVASPGGAPRAPSPRAGARWPSSPGGAPRAPSPRAEPWLSPSLRVGLPRPDPAESPQGGRGAGSRRPRRHPGAEPT